MNKFEYIQGLRQVVADTAAQVTIKKDAVLEVYDEISKLPRYGDLEKQAGVNAFTNPTKSAHSDLPTSKPPTVLVHAQNVHDYFIRHYQEHGWEDLRTFTCVKPAFPKVLITYDHAFTAHYGPQPECQPQRYEEPVLRHMAVAVTELTPQQFSYYLLVDTDPRYKNHADELDQLQAFVRETQPTSILRVEIVSDETPLPGKWFVFIDTRGQVLINEPHGWVFISSIEETDAITQAGVKLEDLQNSFSKHGAIALATLQFLNCRNVEVMDNQPTRQQRRAAERQGERPPVTYKTLVIHPLGRRSGVNLGGTHAEAALHICRGHFKDYRGGQGLGRWHRHGLWWWSPQVRGSAECGRVEKDYDVEVTK